MELQELSIQEKIGQMIIIGMDTNYITDRIRTMITKYKIGGIILYRKNFSTYENMLEHKVNFQPWPNSLPDKTLNFRLFSSLIQLHFME